jgi:protoporphyrinogen oxidase
MRIVILGAGLSGLTVAWNLSRIGRKSEVFEKEREVGGLCRSHSVSGFTFDCSGHVLHFRDPQMCQLVQRLMGGRLRAFARSAWIRACGRYIPYPFQSHLNALPPRIMRECLDGLEKTAPREGGAADFHDWIMRTFGRGVARHFMVPYNSKFWRVHPRALSCDWIGRFVPRRSAAGYNATLWYPRTGGIHTLPRAMAAGMGKVRTGMEAQRVNLAKREVVFRCGRRERFETLVNTVPLPEFIGLCSGVPSEISAAARALRWNSVYTYNFGFSGEGADPGHWVYFPGREYVFFRVGFYHAISGSLVPRGRRAL